MMDLLFLTLCTLFRDCVSTRKIFRFQITLLFSEIKTEIHISKKKIVIFKTEINILKKKIVIFRNEMCYFQN